MKSIEDLRKLREKLQADTKLRHSTTTRVVVGMGTCGIAAGAREVMLEFIDKINEQKLNDVVVQQTGCAGMCEKEVLVDVLQEGSPKITYGRVKVEDVSRIIKSHILENKIVEDLVFAKE